MMICHQKNLVQVFNNFKKRGDIEHLSYGIIYFQVLYNKGEKKIKKLKLIESDDHNRDKNKDKAKDSIINPNYYKFNFSAQKTIKTLLERKTKLLTYLKHTHEIRVFEASNKTNFIHGIGLEGMQDHIISIHPVYGIPYIPASSIKGMVKHWANLAFFNGELDNDSNLDTDQEEELSKERYLKQAIFFDLFGTKERRGLVSFFDIYVPHYEIEPDLITNHYGKYYEGSSPPKDYVNIDSRTEPTSKKGKKKHRLEDIDMIDVFSVDSHEPVQIHFTVQKTNSRDTLSKFTAKELIDLLGGWVRMAFEEVGIGARTSFGYGVFTNFKDLTEDILERMEMERRQKEEEERQQREKERIASLPEDEQLIYRIKQLDPKDEEDIGLSKHPHKIYGEVLKYPKAAPYLKEFWKETGDWTPRRAQKGQREKVDKIKELLGEED